MISGGTWLQIQGPASGTDAGTITCAFSANTGTSARTGTIRVSVVGSADAVNVTVTQLTGDWTAPVPDTGQTTCYDVAGSVIPCPSSGQALYGQDANTTSTRYPIPNWMPAAMNWRVPTRPGPWFVTMSPV